MKTYKFYYNVKANPEPVAIISAETGKMAIEIFKVEYADFIHRVGWSKIEVVG